MHTDLYITWDTRRDDAVTAASKPEVGGLVFFRACIWVWGQAITRAHIFQDWTRACMRTWANQSYELRGRQF